MSTFKKILFGIIYWFMQLTWGILLTSIGAIVTLFCIIFLKGKPHKNGYSVITEVGGNWGGLELGAFALCGNYYGTSYWEEMSAHEFGHSLWHQHWIMGPFFIFLVGIPSACRYWYQRIMREKYNKTFSDDWYIKFWAEEDATAQGLKWKKLLGQVDADYEIKYSSKIFK